MELNVILANKRNASEFLEREFSVYFLIKEDEVIYIGKSTNYMNRLHQHKLTKDFDSFYRVKCNSLEEMERMEFEMICKYKPSLNKTLPSLECYPSANKLKERFGLGAWEFKRLVKNNAIEPLVVFYGTPYYNIRDFDKLEVI